MNEYLTEIKDHLNLKTVNITMKADWKQLEEYLEEEIEDGLISMIEAKDLLSKMQVVVGFGRGFWSGVSAYYYIVYHPENDRFYWYLREYDTEQVSFYALKKEAYVLELLTTEPISGNFHLYDEVMDMIALMRLSNGDWNECKVNELEPAELVDLFGVDTKGLRTALMAFTPGAACQHYPHKEFEEKFFNKARHSALLMQAAQYNQAEHLVFAEDESLSIKMGEEVFKLLRCDS